MKLTPSLLQVMMQDAQKGVSLMLNHNWSQAGVQSIPIGKVFDARLEGSSQAGETTTLYTTQYILRDDSKVDGYSKNDIIKLIETGILEDTSVGWGTTTESYKCSICGHSIYDYRNCEHIPGRKYIVNEETNEVKQCIIEANPPMELHEGNNVLMENSIVFDGAYPNAEIQSAVGGDIDISNSKFRFLNGKADLKKNTFVIGYSTNGNINLLYKLENEKGGPEVIVENNEVVENEETTDVVTEETEVTENVVETNTDTTEDTTNVNETENTSTETTEENSEESTVETETNNETENSESTEERLYKESELIEAFGNIATSLENLITLAKEGEENRKLVIQNALTSGVHCMGNSFNKEVFSKTFSNMQTKDIKEMGETWEQEAQNKFKKDKVSVQDFSNTNEESSMKIDYTQFKTSNY